MTDGEMTAECRERFANLSRRVDSIEGDQKLIFAKLNEIANSQARIETRLNVEEKYADMFRSAALKVAAAIVGASIFLGGCIIAAMKLCGGAL